MPSRNINLTDHYDAYLSEVLASGRYKNASEVVRAGLRLLEHQQAEEAAKLEALRTAVDLAIDDYQNGHTNLMRDERDIDCFFDNLDTGADISSQ